MASTRNAVPNFILTPQQQNLLFAALNSQRSANGKTANGGSSGALTQSPSEFNESPPVQATDSTQESPYLDYDYDFPGDSSFDYSYDNVNGDKMNEDFHSAPSIAKSDSADSESPDKRSHPDDDDDDDVGTAKRRESEDKVAKKPGRKPLTTEPSSKRKAQNRAAQRAFRERKEKHLKDLETKVQELEKASETTNHENEQLRTKVDKLTTELNEYKKRISVLANNRTATQGIPRPFGSSFVNNLNDVNFQFEFPKFGVLPGPSTSSNNNSNNNKNNKNNNNNGTRRSPSTASTSVSSKRANSDKTSHTEKSKDSFSPSNSSTYSQVGLDSNTKEDLASLSAGLFGSGTANKPATTNGSRTSFESHFSTGGATNTSSPSASSNSNACGTSSSCGTSPEPLTQSPMGFKPVETLTTIGEEQPPLISSGNDAGHFANIDVNGFNWLPQNDFQFDPQLFGDYRDPQENILTSFDDSFFNDAFDADFTTPYNVATAGGGEAPKKDLIAQIDAAKDSEESSTPGQLLTCNKIWEELQNCPRVQSGDFDLDGLCSDLQKKAKCSGSGAVVDEKDFKQVMHKYLGRAENEPGKPNNVTANKA